jgi:hypothetical protein
MDDWLPVLQPPEVSAQHIETAFSRLEAFALVNKSRDMDGKREGLDIMVGSLGLSSEQLAIIRVRLHKILKDDARLGPALLGVLAGLFIAEEMYQ